MKMRKFYALLLGSAMLIPTIAYAEPTPEPAAEPQQAQTEKTTWEKILEKLPKVSGYLQSGWNYTSNDAKSTSSFQAKRLRLILDGKVGEKVDFRLQIEAFNGIAGSTNGNGQKNIQVMDAFATWKIMPEFKVRVGQFYTPLGYENYDISPATLETVDFSNIVYRIACRNPYEYNFVDYGRDLGIMVMGDAFDSGKGFKYLHYDVALTNGSLPCKDDTNKSKDIYLSATVRPFKNFNVKGTFNWGEYTGKDTKSPDTYNPMTRYVVGAWYNNPKGLDLRAEFGQMSSNIQGKDLVKETGAYVIAGWHAGKFLPVTRWRN
ncbi:MAG: porin [Muribaculaceae bacterium]|nr:porin [Muribaculaceae bacterium]